MVLTERFVATSSFIMPSYVNTIYYNFYPDIIILLKHIILRQHKT